MFSWWEKFIVCSHLELKLYKKKKCEYFFKLSFLAIKLLGKTNESFVLNVGLSSGGELWEFMTLRRCRTLGYYKWMWEHLREFKGEQGLFRTHLMAFMEWRFMFWSVFLCYNWSRSLHTLVYADAPFEECATIKRAHGA